MTGGAIWAYDTQINAEALTRTVRTAVFGLVSSVVVFAGSSLLTPGATQSCDGSRFQVELSSRGFGRD